LRDALPEDFRVGETAMLKALGIDVGSRYVKFARFEDGRLVMDKVDTVMFYRRCRAPSGGVEISRLEQFENSSFGRIVATGYGRHNVRIKGAEVISEIRAHAEGACHQTGLADFTLIDLGGQDTKAIRVRDGRVDDFLMNDKCAAGSGRYLENIAGMLGLTVEELAGHYLNPTKLSVTCAIFGESEVIGKLADGVEIESICAGANFSVASRVSALMKRFASGTYVVAGGVARNGAVTKFLAERCGGRLVVPEHPTFNGAIGAAITAPAPETVFQTAGKQANGTDSGN